MPEQKAKFYEFADLSEYPLKKRIMIRMADIAFFAAVKLLGSTAKFEVRGWEHFEAIKAAGKIPIYSFWHDRIFLGTYFFRDRGIVIMTSKSFDGEYIARFIQRLGYGAIRGSSSRGGSRALVEMIKGMRDGVPMGFSLDGPRGPRYKAKPGAVMLAKKTGNPLMPFVLEAKGYWQANSWDRMQIPKPFTQALVIIGEPIYVDADADESQIEAKRVELQHSLDDLVEQAKQWRDRSV